jgi:hypothetical protein
MTEYVPAAFVAGIQRGCPRCGAEPDEPCRFRDGTARRTTHQERKV